MGNQQGALMSGSLRPSNGLVRKIKLISRFICITVDQKPRSLDTQKLK